MEELADHVGHLGAEHDVLLDGLAAQVDEAVLQAELLARGDLVTHGEGGRFGLVEHHNLGRLDLDFTRRDLLVGVAAAADHHARDGNHPLRANLSGRCCQRRIYGGVELHLGHAVAVAQVNEGAATQVAVACYPAIERNRRANIGGAECATGL